MGTDPDRRSDASRAAKIYQVAARLIMKKGFDATSMNDIARANKLTKAGLYYYVPGKEALLFAIISYGMETLKREVIAPCEGIEDPAERLRAVVRRHAALQTDIGAAITIVTEEVKGLTAAHRRQIVSQKRAYLEFVRGALEELHRQGRLRGADVGLVSMNLFATILGVARWYRPNGAEAAEAVSESVADFVMGAVLQRPEEK